MFALKVIGGEMVQGRVPSVQVVPTLDPGKDSQARLGFGPPAKPGSEFALQAGKETLGDRKSVV